MEVGVKVGIISYPMLFQRSGGLQIQIKNTISALRKKGVDVSIFDPIVDVASDFDIFHLFSVANGNYKIAEYIDSINKPLVCSPLVPPYWDSVLGIKARFLEKIVFPICKYANHTEYYQMDYCLKKAKVLFALSENEKKSIVRGFCVNESKVITVPNGVSEIFFGANDLLFRERYGIAKPYVLQVSSVTPHKNPLATAKAARQLGLEFVLIGQVSPHDTGYLDKVLDIGNVHFIGPLDNENPLLSSAYAGAAVFCLPSFAEVSPLVTIEALASGTPVVMTTNNSMDSVSENKFVFEVNPESVDDMSVAMGRFIDSRVDSHQCADSVKHLKWNNVADLILQAYGKLLH